MHTLSRRRFVHGLTAGAAVMLSGGLRVPAVSAAPNRLPRIGYLGLGPREVYADLIDAFLQGLREVGYGEGDTAAIEWRLTPEADDAPWDQLAGELVGMPVDLIVVGANTNAALAARRATRTIPIVLAGVSNPVQSGLVDSLTRPGGNVTGLASNLTGAESMQVELLRAMVPGLDQIVDFIVADNPAIAASFERSRSAAEAIGIQMEAVALRSVDDLDAAFETPAAGRAQALLSGVNGLAFGVRDRFAELALKHRLAGLSSNTAFADAGLLMAFGANQPAIPRHAAAYIHRILTGTAPAELPVQEPEQFDLVINMGTADALGLVIPPSIVARVTRTVGGDVPNSEYPLLL